METTLSAVLVLVVKRLLYKNMEVSGINVRVQFKNNKKYVFLAFSSFHSVSKDGKVLYLYTQLHF